MKRDSRHIQQGSAPLPDHNSRLVCQNRSTGYPERSEGSALPQQQPRDQMTSGFYNRLMRCPYLCIFPFFALTLPSSARASIDFNREIRPILAKNCFVCHGPDDAKRKADLRVDTDENIYSARKSGRVPLVPGERSSSELYRRISAAGTDDRMPPVDSGKSLNAEEVELIGKWIDEGAKWDLHWAFKPIRRPTVPEVRNATWPRNPVDRFVLARLEAAAISPSPEADRRTLIRRLSYDILGLPPTPQEIESFLADTSTDAYEQLVDRMLASPRYGERWARHWLDVVHYGDTHGYDKDKRRPNAWPYRDYVIESLNEDKPYGQFAREQIAGDVLSPTDPKAVIATGFIASGPWDFVGHVELREGTTDKKITRLLDRDDMVMNTMTTFASMTVHCARCHNHKFDPVSQQEYYGLQAVFAGVDRADRPVDPDPAVFARRVALTNEKRDLESKFREIDAVYSAVSSPMLDEIDSKLAAARDQLKSLRRSPSNGYHSAIESNRDRVKWVQVDLGEPKTIGSIHLVPARPIDFPDTPGFGFPIRFKIEVSNDPEFKTAKTIVDETGADFPSPADVPYRVDNTGETARHVRVTATKLWERTSDFIFALAELRVTTDGKDLALHAAVTALDSIESGRWSAKYLVDGFSSHKAISRDAEDTAEAEKVEEGIKAMEIDRDIVVDSLVDPELAARRRDLQARLSDVNQQLDALPSPLMTYAAANNFKPDGAFTPADGPRPIHVLRRGDVNQEAEAAVPRALAAVHTIDPILAVDKPDDEGARRAALANWIAHPDNPLTWRSIVNRVWHYHFGAGIVDTPSDFGHMGSLPTHPELLEWLAAEFLEHGQSLKWLHKLIVTSSTYRQTSTDHDAGLRVDASNRLLWKMNRRQLDAESLRDSVLAISGKLDLTMGGPGYDLFEFKDDHSPGYFYDRFDVDDPRSFRRTIYRFIVRSVPDPFMETLDCADPSQNVPVRNTTITALQALAVFNDPFVVRQAEHFAKRLQDASGELAAQLTLAFQLALARTPSTHELISLSEYATQHGLANACRVILNSNEFMFVD